MGVIDLSHTLVDSFPQYPGDKPLTLQQCNTVEQDAYSNFHLETGMHIGTHMDGPAHVVLGGTPLYQIELEHLIRPGKIFEVDHCSDDELIQKMDGVKKNDIVLFCSHQVKIGDPEYFKNHYEVSVRVAEFLVSLEIAALGVNFPGPDKKPYPVHDILLGNGIILIENLCNLEKLLPLDAFEINAIPLKIKTDSALARVFARY